MKFAIVLLALFALAAAVPQQRGIMEDVESMVNGVISKAQADLQSLVTLVKGLTANAQGNIAGIIANAKNQVTSTIAGLESTLSGMIAKGGVVAVCAQKNLGELTEFKDSFGKNVESCAGSLSGALGGFEGNVLSQITTLSASVAELVTIVTECSTSVLDAAVCAFTKVKQVESLIQTIISSGTDAVENARGKITAVVSQVQTCAQQTIGEATIVLNKFTTAVKQCA